MSRSYIENGDFSNGSLTSWISQGVALTKNTWHNGNFAAVFPGGLTNAYLAQSMVIPPFSEFELELDLAVANQHSTHQSLLSISVAFYTTEHSFLEYGLILNISTDPFPSANMDVWYHIKEKVKLSPASAARAILLINKLPAASGEDIYVSQIKMNRIMDSAVSRELAFVANSFSDKLSVIDIRSMRVNNHIDVGSDPTGVFLSPDRKKVFVTNFSGNTITVIDTATQSIAETVQVGQGPSEMAFQSNGQFAYVCNLHSSTISVIDLNKIRVIETIPVHADSLAVSPDGMYLFVTQHAKDSLLTINTSDYKYVRKLAVKAPHGIGITPDGQRLYITNAGANHTVTVVDPTENRIITSIKVGNTPTGITISPDGSKAYVAVSGDASIAVIDLRTQMMEATISIDSTPEKIALTPDGNSLFITEMISNQLSIINTSTLQIEKTIPLGLGPDGIAIGTVYDLMDVIMTN